jgi:hypothetical protein
MGKPSEREPDFGAQGCQVADPQSELMKRELDRELRTVRLELRKLRERYPEAFTTIMTAVVNYDFSNGGEFMRLLRFSPVARRGSVYGLLWLGAQGHQMETSGDPSSIGIKLRLAILRVRQRQLLRKKAAPQVVALPP